MVGSLDVDGNGLAQPLADIKGERVAVLWLINASGLQLADMHERAAARAVNVEEAVAET